MKREQIKKTSLVFATVIVTALFAISLMMASQHTSAAVEHHKVSLHHKAHSASKDSSGSVHKVVAVVPETHGKILDATALEKLTKGPDGNSIVIGGKTSDGY
jgi:hypothetical protein